MPVNDDVGTVGSAMIEATVKEILKDCDTCRFYTVTGQKDSGIKCPDGVTQWLYDVGDCGHPDPAALGGATPDWQGRPCWSSCYQWAKKRRKCK